MNNALKALPPQLPATASEFLANRKIKQERTLNDIVEEVHLQLAEDDAYRAFLYAVYDEQAVEGSLAADNILAAKMIREKAIKTDNNLLAKEKLATISKALGVVLRRYGFSRKERRYMVAGEVVTADNGD